MSFVALVVLVVVAGAVALPLSDPDVCSMLTKISLYPGTKYADETKSGKSCVCPLGVSVNATSTASGSFFIDGNYSTVTCSGTLDTCNVLSVPFFGSCSFGRLNLRTQGETNYGLVSNCSCPTDSPCINPASGLCYAKPCAQGMMDCTTTLLTVYFGVESCKEPTDCYNNHIDFNAPRS